MAQRRQSLGVALKWGGRAFWLLAAAGLVLIFLTRELLHVEIDMSGADWIVVLGGESSQRVIGAAELYHAGVAPLVFVTGSGDCELIARRLVMAGVPPSAVRHECAARNTYENALYTRENLSRFNPKKIMLVTTWHHTRRALATFQTVWPEVEWGSRGVFPGLTPGRFPYYEAGAILAEYVKVALYPCLHGIFPFLRSNPAPDASSLGPAAPAGQPGSAPEAESW